MRHMIIGFLVFLTAFVVVGSSGGGPAFASSDCKGHEATAPYWVNIHSREDVLAKVADHTADAASWKIYFGKDGSLVYHEYFDSWGGNWYSCGAVVVFDWDNDDHDVDRFLTVGGGQISFYNLDGQHLETIALKKGKTF